MKKILCFILTAVFALSLAACGEKEPNKGSHHVDIEKSVSLGRISEYGYKLGDDVESTKKAMQSMLNEEGEPLYCENEAKGYTIMMAGPVYCCYKTDDKSAGLTHIIDLEDAFGFSAYSLMPQIRDTLKEMGYETEERNAKKGEVFFLPGNDFTVLEYKIEGNTVLFIFQEGELCATTIQK